ncbi:MAG: ribosome small subunit-dependent GTPase A [Oscillospiraceae bacterium]|nr:ribosome small subunit-dependent GTPase A [Oscillospiraceae bacterium]
MNHHNQEKHGRVIAVQKNRFTIDWEGQELAARLKGSFYEQPSDQWPLVGDEVSFLYNPSGESIIRSVGKRKSLLQRLDPIKTGAIQSMVANVDDCFIVTALNGDYNYNRIARYVSLALQSGARPVIILTKADLCADVERHIREVETLSDKLRVHAVSALQGLGMEALEEYFVPGRTIALLGSSGAGKSTLINAVAGEEIMKTGAVRASDDKGRHTTTHRQLIRLKNGASIIDTPGMRELGVAGAEEGIDDTFSDILVLAASCRFRDCRHETEPGCAVKAAIMRGQLREARLALYQSLGAENRGNRARMKEISKRSKAYQKSKNKKN